MIKRYLERFIVEDLKEKMVFIAGPHQVSKTTLAQEIGEKFFPNRYLYLNGIIEKIEKSLSAIPSGQIKICLFLMRFINIKVDLRC